jgi:hypothetical protein
VALAGVQPRKLAMQRPEGSIHYDPSLRSEWLAGMCASRVRQLKIEDWVWSGLCLGFHGAMIEWLILY